MHFQQSVKPQSTGSSAVDLLGGTTAAAAAPTSNLAHSSTSAAIDDDEWTFTSAVPDTTKELTVNNTSINIAFNVSRESDTVILIYSRISNNTPSPISGLTFQVAASKVSLHGASFERKLTQPGRSITARASNRCQPRPQPAEWHHAVHTAHRCPKRLGQQH
jgi:hypothetical protein